MSKIRRIAMVVATALVISASATAAPRDDDIDFGAFGSKLRIFVVTILEDIRGSFPPG
jgi:hypothetical protein